MAADRADPETGRRSAPTIGVRVRILATVLALTSVGMGLAGTAFMAFERRQLQDRLDAELTHAVTQMTEGQRAAMGGPRPPRTVTALIRRQLDAHRPAADEVLVGLVDGEPVLVTDGPFDVLTTDAAGTSALVPELRRAVASRAADAPTEIRQVGIAGVGQVRFTAMQVRMEGDPTVGTVLSAVTLQPSLDELTDSARFYALLSTAALLVVGLGAWLVSGRLLRPLRLLRNAADTISHTDLTARIPVRGNDDVTELTRTVNAMLDRLEGAFETQQRFLDDAGHELRTPLTVVRGHLEVLDPTDQDEVRATRDLVLDEVDRMGAMVADLVVLAQSGRPDFVRPRRVDVRRLLTDVLDKAHALGDRRWVLDGAPSGTADLDPHRVTQAMLQLAENAVRHTDSDDLVAVGAARDGGHLLLWVRDTGTGVADEDAERIFERFEGGSDLSQDGSGSGLGLSIVRGIAAAHGGYVALDPGFGTGARFTIVLPLSTGPDGADR